MSRLLHLNGPSGVGKTTLARRYAAEHPGTLCCDIDALRTMVGGWEHDFVGTGELVRTTALAMITAYLAQGRDVVLPQLVLTDDQLDRFADAAAAAGAEHVERRLLADPAVLAARFAARGDHDPWSGTVRALVERAGGEAELRRQSDVLTALPPRPGAAVVTADDDVGATYARLLASLA